MIGNNLLLSQIMSRQPTTPASAPEYTSYTTPAPAPRPGAGMARGEAMGGLRSSFDPASGTDALAGASDTARRAGVSPTFGDFTDALKFGGGLMGARGPLMSAAKMAMGIGKSPLDINNYNTATGWDQTYRNAYAAAVGQGMPQRQAITHALDAATEMAVQQEAANVRALDAAASYGGARDFGTREGVRGGGMGIGGRQAGPAGRGPGQRKGGYA